MREQLEQRTSRTRLRLGAGYLDDAEHACFHMEEQMAVKSPTSGSVRCDGNGNPLSRFNDDGVFARQKGTSPVFKVHPHPVQV